MSTSATKPLNRPPRSSKAAASKADSGAGKSVKVGKMKPKELIRFCRGISSMLRARLTTADSLKFYSQGHSNPLIVKAFDGIRKEIDAGAPAFIAFKKSGLFDDKIIGLIKAGSDSGQLHKAFTAIGERLKIERAISGKIKKATMIPGLVIVALLGIFIGAQCKVTPQIEGLLSDFDAEPDAFSALMFKISHVTRKVYPAFITISSIIVAVIAFSRPVRNTLLAMLMSKIGLLRAMIMGLRQMNFIGSLNMLHANGITLAKSIETAAESVKGTPLHDELIDAGKRYSETGIPFSEAIRKFTSCDPQVAHMISIGEKSSSLVDQLDLLTEMYEEDTAAAVETFTALVNIVVLMMAGVLISVVFIGAFLPVFLMGPKLMASGM